jgi:hypothetical protein
MSDVHSVFASMRLLKDETAPGHCEAVDDGNLPDAAGRDCADENGVRPILQLPSAWRGLTMSVHRGKAEVICSH